MIEQDNRANSRAIDSLLNYETVKYFGNEAHEAARFDEAMQKYERAAVLSQSSLSLLHVGQAATIPVGLTLGMWVAAHGRVAETRNIGGCVEGTNIPLQTHHPSGTYQSG